MINEKGSKDRLTLTGFSAIGVMTSILGVILGIASFEHGFFEVLHGNVAVKVGTIDAIGVANRLWPNATEPAFTLIPNFFITGIAAMTVSLVVIIWSIWFVRKQKLGGLVFLLLSIVQYLVGGGIAPFGLAIIIGIAALWIDRPLTWGWPILPIVLRRVLAMPWLLLVITFSAVFTSTIWGAVFGNLPGTNNPDRVSSLLYDLLYLMEGLLPLMVISVFAHDSLRQIEKVPHG